MCTMCHYCSGVFHFFASLLHDIHINFLTIIYINNNSYHDSRINISKNIYKSIVRIGQK